MRGLPRDPVPVPPRRPALPLLRAPPRRHLLGLRQDQTLLRDLHRSTALRRLRRQTPTPPGMLALLQNPPGLRPRPRWGTALHHLRRTEGTVPGLPHEQARLRPIRRQRGAVPVLLRQGSDLHTGMPWVRPGLSPVPPRTLQLLRPAIRRPQPAVRPRRADPPRPGTALPRAAQRQPPLRAGLAATNPYPVPGGRPAG